jgi:DNA processing protein
MESSKISGSLNEYILYIIHFCKVRNTVFYEKYKNFNFCIEKTVNFFLGNKSLNCQLKLSGSYPDDFFNMKSSLEKNGIRMINISDSYYPPFLKLIYNPPVLLFCKGDKINQTINYISIVGTRKNSVYGRDAAIYFSGELSKLGITIVSGMAAGIDAIAHCAALKYKGGTCGVMGSGIDVVYPPENRKLFSEIPENGSVISEFPPGTPPLKSNFPARNRIISGFSMATIVIEAPEKSGALITAEFALDQNREVFAVPGNIFSTESAGCNNLIKNGARPATSIDDILSEITQFLRSDEPGSLSSSFNGMHCTLKKTKKNLKISPPYLTEEQEILFKIIGYNPVNIDLLIETSKLSINKVLQAISELQIKNLIVEKSLNHFARVC